MQYMLTPAAGKRLIARALASYPPLVGAMREATVVIVAGTTNAYVAQECLRILGQEEGFRPETFMRGVTTPAVNEGKMLVTGGTTYDVVIRRGTWLRERTLFDVAGELREGDIILKGANAINRETGRAGIFIAHPQGGTTLTLLQAVVGRRVRLIIPAGLEKRVEEDVDTLAAAANAPGSEGLRMMPVSGEIITEIEAIDLLTGAKARLLAGGGVGGAEGALWLLLDGDPPRLEKTRKILDEVAAEPLFPLSL